MHPQAGPTRKSIESSDDELSVGPLERIGKIRAPGVKLADDSQDAFVAVVDASLDVFGLTTEVL
jgi:hypothetical protein